MSTTGSITCWIQQVRQGDPAAAEALWKRYFPRLVKLAKAKLKDVPGTMADEEDVALSVLYRFYGAAEEGRYPELADRDGLWRLLFQITTRRVIDLKRRENCQRRGGSAGAAAPLDGSAQPEARDDDPEMAVMMAQQCQELLSELRDEELQAIALAKMDGASNAEIARQRNCSQRTIERRLGLIRDKWRHVLGKDGDE